jgi:hypothetical protein
VVCVAVVCVAVNVTVGYVNVVMLVCVVVSVDVDVIRFQVFLSTRLHAGVPSPAACPAATMVSIGLVQ